jgi:hypothetical protein
MLCPVVLAGMLTVPIMVGGNAYAEAVRAAIEDHPIDIFSAMMALYYLWKGVPEIRHFLRKAYIKCKKVHSFRTTAQAFSICTIYCVLVTVPVLVYLDHSFS